MSGAAVDQPDRLPARAAQAPLRIPRIQRIPLVPVLSAASFRRDANAPVPRSILDAGHARFVTSGRVAIALALRQMHIGAGDTVLVPAYHSLSMIPPVLWRGARPVFYKVGADTAVDLADVAAKLAPNTKAIMVTHYFGFAQDMVHIRAFCDAHALLLLEDCAHCFFGEHAGKPVGSYGDYAIASSMKFFPIYEGGCLVSARHSLDAVTLRVAGAGFEAKAALTGLEHSFSYGRLRLLKAALWLPLMLKTALWRGVKALRPATAALAPGSSDSSAEFDPYWVDKRSARFSRLVMRHVSQARIVRVRRARYCQLALQLHGVPGCRALFATLPDGVCPWLFPLLVDDAEAVFERLLNAGVPVVRFAEQLWPGVDAAVCGNSAYLSRHVLSFPCHQELREEEFDAMALRIQECLHP